MFDGPACMHKTVTVCCKAFIFELHKCEDHESVLPSVNNNLKDRKESHVPEIFKWMI